MPLLDAYYRLQQQHGLRIVAITTEDSLRLDQLKPLARAVSFPMLRQYHGRYGVLRGVPTNYIIDRNGIVRYARAAAFDLEALNTLLVPLLQEQAEHPAEQQDGPGTKDSAMLQASSGD